MRRERVTDDIIVFCSSRYAQVNAAAVLTPEGAVMIGTLVYPAETLQIKRFLEERMQTPVRYVINTHYHADHTNGTCFFPGARVVAHRRCHELLNTRGRASLEEARSSSVDMLDLELVLPDMVFEETLTLHVGSKTLHLRAAPGHTPDSIICLAEEDQVLFAADTVMPIPYFHDGDYDGLLASLRGLHGRSYESIVQGYGEIILRGEVDDKLSSDIDYLVKLDQAVTDALESDHPDRALDAIDIESCGKSRVLLNGIVEQLHRQNVRRLAQQRSQPQPD
ncbi:MAG: MBL fold metallo-hydrolase [Chloroflexota bacterium]